MPKTVFVVRYAANNKQLEKTQTSVSAYYFLAIREGKKQRRIIVTMGKKRAREGEFLLPRAQVSHRNLRSLSLTGSNIERRRKSRRQEKESSDVRYERLSERMMLLFIVIMRIVLIYQCSLFFLLTKDKMMLNDVEREKEEEARVTRFRQTINGHLLTILHRYETMIVTCRLFHTH